MKRHKKQKEICEASISECLKQSFRGYNKYKFVPSPCQIIMFGDKVYTDSPETQTDLFVKSYHCSTTCVNIIQKNTNFKE